MPPGPRCAGTLSLLYARSFTAVLMAQFVPATGGTLVLPALTSLTLGVVGKAAFPRQQGRNQAYNHGGILVAALLVAGGVRFLGASTAFLVLGGMALGAVAAVATTPANAWNGRRAHGWQEDEPDEVDRRHPLLGVLTNHRLVLLATALALFNLGNGAMLSLAGQRLVATGTNATAWTATYVIVAQLTMIPVALWAGSLAGKRWGRSLLLIACLGFLCVRFSRRWLALHYG